MRGQYRECEHCGSTHTRQVAQVNDMNAAGVVTYYWVRWECRDCHRSSETKQT